MRENKNKIINLILALIPLACILLLWQVEAKKIDNEFILTDVGATFKALLELLKEKTFYKSLGDTIARTLIAFGVSFVIATMLAFLSRISKRADLRLMVCPFARCYTTPSPAS